MLLNPKIVCNTKYLAGTTFPNDNVPFLNAELHKYVAQGFAKEMPDDKPVDLEEKIAEEVGKVKLPLIPEEQKIEIKKEQYPEIKTKEEKIHRTNVTKSGKKPKEK
jgi:hypothetical protein